ncbi:MAG TPA: hypothetical protein VJ528_11385 [Geothrix sp.]|nr:hypothetical protein [Geothrix sp.]
MKPPRPLRLVFFCLLAALSGPLVADAPPAAPAVPVPAPAIQAAGGYLVVHLPDEGVTVVGQPLDAGAVDTGWATWTQRGGLLWRGEMEDGQGRRYNVRILPGYVAPWRVAGDGWRDAGRNLSEYGQGDTWTTMGHHMRDTFKWGWKTSFWEFGLKGTGEAWSGNFEKARQRTARKTFGWPLSYPWAFVASAFESALRVPLGVAGAAIGTAGAGAVIPVMETAWPALKATGNAAGNGVILPVAGWSWQTVAAPPAALFASAPSPARADGLWMKVEDPAPVRATTDTVPDAVLADLAGYATQTAALEADQTTSLAGLRRREEQEVAAVRSRYAAERKAVEEARAQRLQAWAAQPGNREALLRLARVGGDAATLRAARAELVQRLAASGLGEPEARAAIDDLVMHPPAPAARPAAPPYDKTDPLRGALGTTRRVGQDAGKHGL